MDRNAQIEERFLEIKLLQTLSYVQRVKDRFRDQPEVYPSFKDILYAYKQQRSDIFDVLTRVCELFGAYPELIRGFCSYLPSEAFIKDDVDDESMENLRPAKKAKIEDGSNKPISEFGPTSNATASYSSNYSHDSHSSCASGSSSDTSAENAAELHYAQNEKAAQLREGTAYVTDMKNKVVDRSQVYQHFIELIKETRRNRVNIHELMENASNLLQGYPELMECFNKFLPDGLRIPLNDKEMSTD